LHRAKHLSRPRVPVRTRTGHVTLSAGPMAAREHGEVACELHRWIVSGRGG
jgi:hypothetical protein